MKFTISSTRQYICQTNNLKMTTIPSKKGTEKMEFAVMRWLNDGNRLSVHNMNQIVEPKLPFNDYKVGTCGVALYKGCPGMWQFRILRLGGKKEMQKWLDCNIIFLTADATDIEFCEEKAMTEDIGCSLNAVQKPKRTENEAMTEDIGCSLNAVQSPKRTENEAMTEDIGCSLNAVQSPKRTENEAMTEDIGCSLNAVQSPKRTENEGYNASSNYLNNRGDSKDRSSEKVERLEEDLRSLRRKYRKLEERVVKLEGSSTQAEPRKSTNIATVFTRPEAETAPGTEIPAALTAASLGEDDILAAAKGIHGEQNIFKALCLKVFTEKEIVNSTKTGKRTIKCMDNVKPALSAAKFALLESSINKMLPTMDKAVITKKFQNLQKVLRRETK